jgi:hypothetical protein
MSIERSRSPDADDLCNSTDHFCRFWCSAVVSWLTE